MENKIIVIVGGSSGIGKYLCTKLVAEKNIVINADISNSVISEVSNKPGLQDVYLDVTSNDQIFNLSKHIDLHFGKVDTFIYAPAPYRGNRKSFPENLDTMDHELNVLLTGAMSCIRYFYPLMLTSENPSILLMGSILGSLIAHESLGYHLSKAALIQGMNYFAVNLAKHKIRVNMISPGLVKREGPLIATEPTNDEKNSFEAYIKYAVPLGRPSEYYDIYKAASFLISSNAQYITGSNLELDGGLTLQEPFNLTRNYTAE